MVPVDRAADRVRQADLAQCRWERAVLVVEVLGASMQAVRARVALALAGRAVLLHKCKAVHRARRAALLVGQVDVVGLVARRVKVSCLRIRAHPINRGRRSNRRRERPNEAGGQRR